MKGTFYFLIKPKTQRYNNTKNLSLQGQHFPTKHLCILVPAPYLHQFSAVSQMIHFFSTLWEKFASYLVLI